MLTSCKMPLVELEPQNKMYSWMKGPAKWQSSSIIKYQSPIIHFIHIVNIIIIIFFFFIWLLVKKAQVLLDGIPHHRVFSLQKHFPAGPRSPSSQSEKRSGKPRPAVRDEKGSCFLAKFPSGLLSLRFDSFELFDTCGFASKPIINSY